jgi:hypothetical protein
VILLEKFYLDPVDVFKLEDAVDTVRIQKASGNPCTITIPLHSMPGTAKIYHMGQNNPVVRIDLKLEG